MAQWDKYEQSIPPTFFVDALEENTASLTLRAEAKIMAAFPDKSVVPSKT